MVERVLACIHLSVCVYWRRHHRHRNCSHPIEVCRKWTQRFMPIFDLSVRIYIFNIENQMLESINIIFYTSSILFDFVRLSVAAVVVVFFLLLCSFSFFLYFFRSGREWYWWTVARFAQYIYGALFANTLHRCAFEHLFQSATIGSPRIRLCSPFLLFLSLILLWN